MARIGANLTQVSTILASCGRIGDKDNSTFTSRGKARFIFALGGGGGEITSFLPVVPYGHGWGTCTATLS